MDLDKKGNVFKEMVGGATEIFGEMAKLLE